jgi:hypothetical protein
MMPEQKTHHDGSKSRAVSPGSPTAEPDAVAVTMQQDFISEHEDVKVGCHVCVCVRERERERESVVN